MRKIYVIIKLVLLLFWSLIMIIFSMLIMLITFESKLAVKVAHKMWSPIALKILGVKLKIHGKEKIDPSKTCIVMSNHSSYLDIPVLLNTVPFNLYFIAKMELKKVPFLNFYMRMVGMIFIERGNSKSAVDSINKAGETIRSGRNVIIFPEGTSKGGEDIMKFKKGGFYLAESAGVDILPIRIKGTAAIWPTGDTLNLKSGMVDVFIGDYYTKKIESKDDINSVANELELIIEKLG